MVNLRSQRQWIEGCLETGEVLFVGEFVTSQTLVCGPKKKKTDWNTFL